MEIVLNSTEYVYSVINNSEVASVHIEEADGEVRGIHLFDDKNGLVKDTTGDSAKALVEVLYYHKMMRGL